MAQDEDDSNTSRNNLPVEFYKSINIKIPKERSLSIVYIKSLRSIVVTDGTCSPSLSLTMLYTTNTFNKLRGCVWTVQSNYTIDHNTLEFPKHDSARWLQLLQGQLILMRMVSCTTIPLAHKCLVTIHTL